jgi:DNA-binding NtrC family response regulator
LPTESRLTGTSAYARRIVKLVQKLGQGKEDVLILGEPGTGRKTVALEIHGERGRRKPVVLLDLASATDAEVRAVIAGGDTAAAAAHTGRRYTDLTDGATLVLGDIEACSPHLQALLASFLKDGRKKYAGLKVIVTARYTLLHHGQAGTLLPELIAHMEKFEIVEIPALRDRMEDIPHLVATITKHLCAAAGKPMKELEDTTMRTLVAGQWPGNVRQLVAVLGRSVHISHGDTLELPAEFLDERQHLTDAMENIHTGQIFVLDQTLDLIERLLIQRALRQFQYNQSRTAQVLGLSEANFRYRLKKFGLPSIRQKV